MRPQKTLGRLPFHLRLSQSAETAYPLLPKLSLWKMPCGGFTGYLGQGFIWFICESSSEQQNSEEDFD